MFASILVSGPNAERVARELRAALAAGGGPGESVSPVELDRSADLVVAVVGVVFAGVSTAKTIWDWWQSRRAAAPTAGVTVRVVLDDGAEIELAGVNSQQLALVFERYARHADGDTR